MGELEPDDLRVPEGCQVEGGVGGTEEEAKERAFRKSYNDCVPVHVPFKGVSVVQRSKPRNGILGSHTMTACLCMSRPLRRRMVKSVLNGSLDTSEMS